MQGGCWRQRFVWGLMRKATDGGDYGGLEDGGGALRWERWLKEEGESLNVARRTLWRARLGEKMMGVAGYCWWWW